jgi:hypothetical protein
MKRNQEDAKLAPRFERCEACYRFIEEIQELVELGKQFFYCSKWYVILEHLLLERTDRQLTPDPVPSVALFSVLHDTILSALKTASVRVGNLEDTEPSAARSTPIFRSRLSAFFPFPRNHLSRYSSNFFNVPRLPISTSTPFLPSIVFSVTLSLSSNHHRLLFATQDSLP